MKYFFFLIFTFQINLIEAQQRLVTIEVSNSETGQLLKEFILNIDTDPAIKYQGRNGKIHWEITLHAQEIKASIESKGYEKQEFSIVSTRDSYPIQLQPQSKILEGVIITGVAKSTIIRENPIAITAVSTQQIEKTSENNIVDALVKNVPGLNAVKTGPNISKPFIRGLGYNRVLTLYDGMRQEGQQYGDEHGLEVDDYNIVKAEVVKGPASLLYGSDAIAGVVSLFPFVPTKNDGIIHGKWIGEWQGNNDLLGSGLRLDYAKGKWVTSMNTSYRMAKNYTNPIDGRVYLTNFNVMNFSFMAGLNTDRGYTQLHFTHYNNHQGIPDGSRDANSRKFTKQIAEGNLDIVEQRPVVSEIELNSYTIPVLAQQIMHHRIYLKNQYEIGNGLADVLLGVQQNVRKEFTHPTQPSLAGMWMRLQSLNYSARYTLPLRNYWELSLGINGMFQKNKNQQATDFPIPDYYLADTGVSMYLKWKKNKWTMSGGLRYDSRYISWDNFWVKIQPLSGFAQPIPEYQENAKLQFEAFQQSFNGISGSLGGTYQISKKISLKANIGRGYRAPNSTEIGSNGLDPGAHIIYLGNKNFKPEFSLQEDLGISFQSQNFNGELNVFHNSIQNYIYMAVLADGVGKPIVDNQGNKTYQYQQSWAQLYGAELWWSLFMKNKRLRWDNSMSFVQGNNKNKAFENKGVEGEYLPLIPPFTFTTALQYRWELPFAQTSISPKFEVEHHAAQNRFLGLNDTETRTADYTLFHVGFFVDMKIGGTNVKWSVQVQNILDKAYQSHLNRLKYFENNYSTNNPHNGIYNMGRNWTFKLIIPI